MKKKLLAVVLSVVMIASLLVPMFAISAADEPSVTISLGEPVLSGNFIKIPVYLSGNNAEMCAIEYKVYSIEKLTPLVVETGTFVDSYTNAIGAVKGITFDAQGTPYNEYDGYSGFKVLNDSSELDKGIKGESGLIAEAYFSAPTTPGTYTFRVVGVSAAAFIVGAQSKEDVKGYIITNGEDKTYTVECTSHINGEPVVTPATCETAGSSVVRCTVCGAEISKETIPALGHDMVVDEAASKAATCGEDGVEVKKCSREGCDKTESKVLTATGNHTEADVIIKDADCGNDGSKKVVCSVCGDTIKESVVIPATGNHSYGISTEKSVAATCEEVGKEVSVCSVCGDETERELAALGHDWNEGVADATKVCGETADVVYTCEREGCGKTKTETGATIPHAWVVDEDASYDPECEKDGLKVEKCTRANCPVGTNETVIDALGHDMVEDEDAHVDPTCEENGKDVFVCANDCGKTEEVTIEALGHDYSGEINVNKWPTATEEGAYTVACVNGCGKSEEKVAKKLAASIEDEEAGISIKAEEPVLPEDVTMIPDESTVKVENGKYSVNFNFSSELAKELKGKAEIALSLEGTEEMDNIQISVVNADGTTTVVSEIKDGKLVFKGDLEGTYQLSFTEKVAEEKNPEEPKNETPKTGDSMNTVVTVLVALAAVAGLVVVGKKRVAL